jgi:trehalose 6-phosphate phosphatase
MTNQDVVLPDMGIAAAAALPCPGRALLACRGAAGAVSSLRRRGAYGGLPGAAADGGEPFLGARSAAPLAAAASAPVPTCTSRVVEAIRASSPTRCPAVDEYEAWTVSRRAVLLISSRAGWWLRSWCRDS